MERYDFEIRTREGNQHCMPHVHVKNSCTEISIAIEDGRLLGCSGRLANIRRAQEWVNENRQFLREMWNQYSDCKIKFNEDGHCYSTI